MNKIVCVEIGRKPTIIEIFSTIYIKKQLACQQNTYMEKISLKMNNLLIKLTEHRYADYRYG